jgi:hypothetical protein
MYPSPRALVLSVLCVLWVVACTPGTAGPQPTATRDPPAPAEPAQPADPAEPAEPAEPVQPVDWHGLHGTSAELQVWRARAEEGPYRVDGDVAAGSPGDWARVVDNAQAFFDDPAAVRWRGPDTDDVGCVPQHAPSPGSRGTALRDAAFVALVTARDDLRQAVRNELVAQAVEPGVDFSDEDRWCRGVIMDVNPGFELAQWLTALLFAYDYVGEGAFSTEDRQLLDSWFDAAATWQARDIDLALDALYVDRDDGDYRPADADPAYRDALAYFGGPRIGTIARHYNNRRAAQARFVALVGVHQEISGHISVGKRFGLEFLAFSMFPQGASGDSHRWKEDQPGLGWSYAANALGSVVTIADALARVGDRDLMDQVASCGLHGTEGWGKTLLLALLDQHAYVGGTFERYATDDAADVGREDRRIDGFGVHDVWTAQANRYYRQEALLAAYTRTGPGYPGYAESPPPNGPFSPWTGEGGIYPGALLLFGQMENVESPYPDQPLIEVVEVHDPCRGRAVRAGAERDDEG